jgi:hypothetical protein
MENSFLFMFSIDIYPRELVKFTFLFLYKFTCSSVIDFSNVVVCNSMSAFDLATCPGFVVGPLFFFGDLAELLT